ncbi:MAG: TIGR03619 family F420-dependent LLM class oxidoreductase [Candidatus Binatia bacterium]
MEYWVLLAQYEPVEDYLQLAQDAEQLGYEGLLLADHVVFPKTFTTPHPLGHPTLSNDLFPDPLSMVVAMASVTRTLRFATGVYVLPMRDPFPVAKQVATTAMLSRYRFAFGIGVGWLPEEFALMGKDFRTRDARTDEMIDILRDLWDDGYAEYSGRFYRFDRCAMFPVPQQHIPIWVGGTSPAAIRRAARCDGYLPMNTSFEQATQLLRALEQARTALGNSIDGFDVMLFLTNFDDVARYQALEGLKPNRGAVLLSNPAHKDLNAKRRALEATAKRLRL